MLDEMFMNKYRIASARAQWHEYNGGLYFVTICTKEREHYFGEIINVDDNRSKNENNEKLTPPNHAKPTMVLSPIGQYAHEQFRDVTKHYPYAEITLWVVMPNHIHAVVMIDENVETMCTSSLQWRTTLRPNNGQQWRTALRICRAKMNE